MYHSLRLMLTRPFESLLLWLTLAFGVAILGIIVTLAAPGMIVSGLSTGLSSREIIVQARENDYQAFYSSPDAPPVMRVGRVGDLPVTLNSEDLTTLKAEAPAIQSAYLNEGTLLGDPNLNIQVQSVTAQYLSALMPRIVEGTLINAAEYRNRSSVLVLTTYGATYLFPKGSAVGQSLQGYRVVGVVEIPANDRRNFRSTEQTEFGSFGFIPYGAQNASAERFTTPLTILHFLPIAGRESEATEQLSAAVLRRWGDRVTLNSNTRSKELFQKATRRGSIVLALMGMGGVLVASLSLLSLMLSRVAARQRHLGIAAALGSTRTRLRGQLLLEIFVVSLLGSLSGSGLAAALLWWFNQSSDPMTAQKLSVQPAILLGTAVGATLLSVLLGLLPAIQASQVRPAEALRA